MMKNYGAIHTLVVDDSEVQRNHVIHLCQEMGVSMVAGAVDGVKAMEKLNQEAYDIVFVDLEMPNMDGVELLRQIASEKLADSVIILSSKDPVLILSVGTMAESDGLKVLGTFQKPILKEHLNCSFKLFSDRRCENEDEVADIHVSGQELLQGIKRREISLAYQPKVTTTGCLLKGVEALARWNHPDLGFVRPSEFIDLSERFGIITDLTLYLYEEALAQKKSWNNKGIRFHLSFNLSPLSLTDRKMVKKIIDKTQELGISPKEIVLEVTENALEKEISSAIEVLAKFRLKGFNIAIDDYGTGFANAQQLARVPANELKIDRSLVHNVATKPQQQVILKSTVNLARDLNLSIVAEGVENEGDLHYLQSLDIDLIQGYIIAKPMGAETLSQWFKTDLRKVREGAR